MVLLKLMGVNPVVVHGGGPQISAMLDKAGVKSAFVDGLRHHGAALDPKLVREGTHTEVGPFGVEKWLEIYATHAHRHARQIVEALGRATSGDSRAEAQVGES